MPRTTLQLAASSSPERLEGTAGPPSNVSQNAGASKPHVPGCGVYALGTSGCSNGAAPALPAAGPCPELLLPLPQPTSSVIANHGSQCFMCSVFRSRCGGGGEQGRVRAWPLQRAQKCRQICALAHAEPDRVELIAARKVACAVAAAIEKIDHLAQLSELACVHEARMCGGAAQRGCAERALELRPWRAGERVSIAVAQGPGRARGVSERGAATGIEIGRAHV